MVKRIFGIAALALLLMAGAAFAATFNATFNDAAAPQGTHVQTGTPTCTTSSSGVTCSTYELAGVGNTNARATLNATYSATVRCRNHGGQIVDVKSQVVNAPATTGSLSPKNGRLTVPELSTSQPTASAFERRATCPNRNWTKETLPGTIQLVSFTYTLHFVGFIGNYITITGP
jgi:hypothetical protein